MGGLAAVALGGCTARSDPSETGTPTNRRKPTETETPPSSPTAPPPDFDLSFEAEVRAQASESTPPRLGASLTNEANDPIRLGMGPALLFSDTAGGDLERRRGPDGNRLVTLPDTHIGPNTPPERRTDGCWTYRGEEYVQSIVEWRTLDPGEALSEQYSLYNDADDDSCFPPGEYVYQDRIYVATESRATVLTLTVTVEESRDVGVAAADPDPPS